MAVATATKVRALKRDFKTGAALADLLGVNRSQVTRWLRGAGIDPLNAVRWVNALLFGASTLCWVSSPGA